MPASRAVAPLGVLRKLLRIRPQCLTLVPAQMPLAPELKELLFRTQLSLGNQTKLADSLGVNPATISRWLSDAQGIDVGACLQIAKLTRADPAKVLRWAGHDPDRYLSGSLVLSPEADEIMDRARLLEWERLRRQIPERFRPAADRTVQTLLDTYRDACADTATAAASGAPHPTSPRPSRQRSRAR